MFSFLLAPNSTLESLITFGGYSSQYYDESTLVAH